MQEYKTVEKEASDFFIEKKSKFIGYAKPVKTQEEAVEFISKIKSKHWDATHNVYAYVLRENNIQRYSDDGEPSGTAGVPVLDVMLKESLVDVCVVATRYFGGTLLGAGGLVRAYSHTSKIALESAGIITMAQCSVMSAEVDYSFYDRLNILLSDSSAVILNTSFSDKVCVEFSVKENIVDLLNAKLIDVSNGKYALKFLRSEFSKTI
ncbi:YigZ family protein [Eubacterium sp.]|uniref:YigZ family protein n=1 Tax=Eubacterium sp. TaxID=142586 RepID=UPI00260D3F59|nr:YigZ family protein [Eubacterium sp.]MDD7331256.1 YigZ family protein [Eubacterium sp.]